MKTLVKNEFRQTRKTLLIWLGIMLLLCGFCYFELLSLKDSLDEMARTVGQFPRLIMIMFGVKGDLTTALGWYACIYFWEGLLAFAYAISLGLSCVAREKKFGTSEYRVHKACGAENHCSGEGDRFSSEPAGVRPVQRRVQLFHDRSSFGRSGSAGSGAFHNDGNVLYPASLFCLGSAVCQPFQIL